MRAFNSGLKEFLKSKFFIILLCVSIFLTIIPTVLTSMGRVDLLRSAVNFIATPFKNFAKFCGDSLKGFSEYFTEFDRLKSENELLLQQLEEEKKKNSDAEIIKAENEWLRNFVLFASTNNNLKLTDALTVGKEDGDFIATFTLNKGTLDGIHTNMAVLNEKGIIGYVCEVGLTYCKVSTIIRDGASVGVICPRTSEYGLIEGNIGFSKDGLCKMVIPTESSEIKVGDSIVTSGVGKVYPFGIGVGTVMDIKRDPYSRNMVAYIKPFVDFKDINRVLIVMERDNDKEIKADNTHPGSIYVTNENESYFCVPKIRNNIDYNFTKYKPKYFYNVSRENNFSM